MIDDVGGTKVRRQATGFELSCHPSYQCSKRHESWCDAELPFVESLVEQVPRRETSFSPSA
jgi:hypothetical protein